jgi:hypothetical protein
MGNIFDLDAPTRITGYARCVPGPVRRLDAGIMPSDNLLLRWQAPRGVRISGYRIERTREGREYELIGETTRNLFYVRNPAPGEPWFYRVTGFNARGAGGFRLVWLYRRADLIVPGGPNRYHLLQPVMALPGLRVTVCE